jgi:hypothetical protein
LNAIDAFVAARPVALRLAIGSLFLPRPPRQCLLPNHERTGMDHNDTSPRSTPLAEPVPEVRFPRPPNDLA